MNKYFTDYCKKCKRRNPHFLRNKELICLNCGEKHKYKE